MNRGYRRNPSNPSSFLILDSNTIMEDHSTMIKTSKQLTLHFIRLQVVSSHIPSCTTFYEICKQNQKKKKEKGEPSIHLSCSSMFKKSYTVPSCPRSPKFSIVLEPKSTKSITWPDFGVLSFPLSNFFHVAAVAKVSFPDSWPLERWNARGATTVVEKVEKDLIHKKNSIPSLNAMNLACNVR